jgi:hypothetical protein
MKPGSTLAAALDLAGQDYAVLPCRLNKKPACPHGFQDADTDPEAVRTWSQFPGTSLASRRE